MTLDINFDELFITLGQYGRWQMSQATGLAFCWIHAAISIFFVVIAGYTPPHICKNADDSNSSDLVPQDSCMMINITGNTSIGCLYGHSYNISNRRASIVSEWNLVCDRDYLPQLSQTLYMAGQSVGAYVFTFFADKYGRKWSHLTAHLLLILIEVAGSFVPTIQWFIVVRFFGGLAQMGVCTTVYVYTMEMFPSSVNRIIGAWIGMMWAIGACITPLLGHLFEDQSWRCLQLTIACIYLIIIYQLWQFDESIRWLYANNKEKEACRIIRKAAKINKADIVEIEKCLGVELSNRDSLHYPMDNLKNNHLEVSFSLLHERKHATEGKDSSIKFREIPAEKLNFFDILKHSKLRRHLFVSWFLWPTHSLTYYGLALMSNQLAGNRYLNFFYNGVVEIPGKIIIFLLMNRFSRKLCFYMNVLPCAVALVTASILSTVDQDLSSAVTALSIIGKFFISTSFMILWIYMPELYPTNLRSSGLGSASASARFAGMAAPFAGYMATYMSWGPGTILGVMCVISCILAFFLPETRNKPLIQTINQVQCLYEVYPEKLSPSEKLAE